MKEAQSYAIRDHRLANESSEDAKILKNKIRTPAKQQYIRATAYQHWPIHAINKPIKAMS